MEHADDPKGRLGAFDAITRNDCAELESSQTFLNISPTTKRKIREFIHQGATASYPSPNLRLVVVVSLTELVPHHPFFWNNLEAVGEEDEGDRPNQCPRCGEAHGQADEHCGEPDERGARQFEHRHGDTG